MALVHGENTEACSVLERIRKELASVIARLKLVAQRDEPRGAGVSQIEKERCAVAEEHALLDQATTLLKAVPHDIPQRNDFGLVRVDRGLLRHTGHFLGQTLDLQQAMRTLPSATISLLEEFRITNVHASLERCGLLNSLEFCAQQLEVAIGMLCLDSCRDLIRPSPVLLWRLVEDAISAAWNDRDRHLGIEVSYFLEKDVPEQVLVDEGRLRQVLVGILSNAFRFTNSGDVILHVTLTATDAMPSAQSVEQQKALRIGIHDTGLGMKPDTASTLFESSTDSSSPAATTDHAPRVCMGLRLCSFLIGLMDGKVLVQSRPGIGTSVYITIPQNTSSVQRPQSQQEQLFPFSMNTSLPPFQISDTASPIAPSTRPTEHQKAVLRGKRVVLLDGSKFLVRGLRMLCELMEMRISYCNVEPHEPFVWLRTEASKIDFDIVIMDLWQFGSAVTDETLARWKSSGTTLVLMCSTEDWNKATETLAKQTQQHETQRAESKSQVLAPEASPKLPAFVTHLPKPILFSKVPDLLVSAVEASTRAPDSAASVVELDSAKPERTRRQDTEQEEEAIAAREWRERTGTDAAEISARAAAKQLELENDQRDAQEPLSLLRMRGRHRGSRSDADWQERRARHNADAAAMLLSSHEAASAATERAQSEAAPAQSSTDLSPHTAEADTSLEEKILVAEDSLVSQRLVLRMLGRLGYKADIADNGRQAVEKAMAFPYQIILMDVSMPVLNGLDATRMILQFYREGKGPAAAKREPVVVSMTAMTDQERCFEAGMKDFIGKPFTMETLRTKLKKWMPSSSAESREHDKQASSIALQISATPSAAGAADAVTL